MATILITLFDNGFPDDFNGDPKQFVGVFCPNVGASIPDTNLILGRVGGSAPTSDIGPWLDNGVWKYWSGSAYVPMRVVLGDNVHTLDLTVSGLTANRTVTFQDKTGFVALQSDIYEPRPTITLTGTTVEVDWSTGFSFFQSLTGNTAYTFSNSQPGQEIHIVTTNNSHTTAFPTSVVWEGGTEPSETGAGTDMWLFYNDAGLILGQQKADFS